MEEYAEAWLFLRFLPRRNPGRPRGTRCRSPASPLESSPPGPISGPALSRPAPLRAQGLPQRLGHVLPSFREKRSRSLPGRKGLAPSGSGLAARKEHAHLAPGPARLLQKALSRLEVSAVQSADGPLGVALHLPGATERKLPRLPAAVIERPQVLPVLGVQHRRPRPFASGALRRR